MPLASREEVRVILRCLLQSPLLGGLVDELPTSVLAGESRVLQLLLHHPDGMVRSSVVDRLPETKRTSSLLSLSLLQDEDRFVRASALEALMEVGKLTVEIAREVAENDPSRWVRAKAAGIAVTRFQDSSQQMNLAKLCLSRDKVVASMAIRYMDEAIFDQILEANAMDYLRKNFDRMRPGLDPGTRESIEYVRSVLYGNVSE